MKKTILWALAAALVLSGGVYGYQLNSASGKRPDCPGEIVCPLTGHPVCADRCPLHPGGGPRASHRSCCRPSHTAG